MVRARRSALPYGRRVAALRGALGATCPDCQVAYGTQLETLMPRMAAAVAEVPRILRDPGPAVFLSAFAADGLSYTVYGTDDTTPIATGTATRLASDVGGLRSTDPA
jgi:hypothetical protein